MWKALFPIGNNESSTKGRIIMKKVIAGLILGIALLAGVFVGCSNAGDDSGQKEVQSYDILVSAAASMQDALEELGATYEAENEGAKITYTFGASGTLQTQIEEGAPADIFLSAGKKQMTALVDGGLMEEDTVKDLLMNELVLITPEDSTLGLSSFEDVIKPEVTKIGLGEPSSVPVGQYSEEVFTYLGILDQVNAKAVFGSDVRTVLTWVESGEVDCGVVYSTDAAVGEGVKVVAEAPEGSHKDIVYPIGVLKDSQEMDNAKKFVEFLSSDEAKTVFEKYGFIVL